MRVPVAASGHRPDIPQQAGVTGRADRSVALTTGHGGVHEFVALLRLWSQPELRHSGRRDATSRCIRSSMPCRVALDESGSENRGRAVQGVLAGDGRFRACSAIGAGIARR